MKSQTGIHPDKNMAEASTTVQPGRMASMFAVLHRMGQIIRAVLQGYTAGQPINESRPRKGCC